MQQRPGGRYLPRDEGDEGLARELLLKEVMSPLEVLVPAPRLVEVSTVDLDARPELVWEHLRHQDLASVPLVRALFALRTLPSRRFGSSREVDPESRHAGLRFDDFRSTPEAPGFQLLAERPNECLTVGAIGKLYEPDIPFLHVDGPEGFQSMAEPGWVKVAWEVRFGPLGESGTRLTLEVRVDATDEESWQHFKRYWRFIGPGSRFVRSAVLANLRARFGALGDHDDERALSGDDLLSDALEQITHGITIQAKPEAIWPWLVQMGDQRAGFYSIDALDNGNTPSAREIHPELQDLRVGQVIPAAPEGVEGFEVLALEPHRALVLGGLFDNEQGRQLPFHSPRPQAFWHVTWAFDLEPLDEASTRLRVRARAAFPPRGRLHAAWIRPVHALMESAQLRNLAARAEGRLARDTFRDVFEGVGGGLIMLLDLVTPFLRPARSHWGLTAEEARQPRRGDELVPDPLWSWTHAIEIDGTPEQIWHWVAQLGADRAGFYSYQWLENLAGCDLKNAEAIHPEWAHGQDSSLVLHPKAPPMPIAVLHEYRALIAFSAADEEARAAGRPWATASWAFLIEPVEPGRCRLISRFRSACSSDLASRFAYGPLFGEPVGFAMDRRMLLGIRDRVDKARSRSSDSHQFP